VDATTASLLVATGLLAYANGANDNFKGVATLYGSRTFEYRGALLWATATSLAGSVAAVFLANGLIGAFRGTGIVPESLTQDARFLSSVGLGAGATVLLASRIGIPISTTHALLGGLVGAGFIATSGGIDPRVLASKFVLPLLVSPFLAIALTAGAYPLLRAARGAMGVTRDMCLCEGARAEPVVRAADGALALRSSGVSLTVAQSSRCEERYLGRVLGIDAQRVLDAVHVLSAGLVGFARGMNDAPKIAALLVGAGVAGASPALWGVAGAIAVGGVLGSRRVAETLSHRITSMNHGQAFTANAATAAMVLFASRFGVPVSTTHVSVGSLTGLGLANGTARWRTLATIGGAWVTTLPLAALLAAAAYLVPR